VLDSNVGLPISQIQNMVSSNQLYVDKGMISFKIAYDWHQEALRTDIGNGSLDQARHISGINLDFTMSGVGLSCHFFGLFNTNGCDSPF
jgi:hypothetical protein